jgi:hypothetical protein
VRDMARTHGDPSLDAAFHAPLVGALEGRDPLRVEVPLTRNKAETRHLAGHVALARGWERQVDRRRNPLFYDDEPIDGARYVSWLRENAVAFVALPQGVPFDPAGEDEARLVASGLPDLREVARPGRWRLFAVRDPTPPAGGGAGLTPLGADAFAVQVPRPQATLVRIRYSPYWAPVTGRGCVGPGPGGWTRVEAARAGRLEIRARFAPGRMRAGAPRCR